MSAGGVVADVGRKCIVITITDEGEAYDIASAYGRHDAFYLDVMRAAAAVWDPRPGATS